MILSLRLLSSLVKVFPDEEPSAGLFSSFSMLRDERFSFQAAFEAPADGTAEVSVDSKLGQALKICHVDCVYAPFPTMKEMPLDEDVLRLQPGWFPDVLRPVENGITAVYKGWNSLWITVRGREPLTPGTYPITVRVTCGSQAAQAEFTLTVLNVFLPEQTLINTNWFHADCLAQWYGCEVFSEPHWEYMEKYIRCAAEHGQNMLYVPLFTPPLDTEIGEERRTVQLLDITREGEGDEEKYTFDFARTLRYMTMAQQAGMRWFEIVHLFTQWGAAWTPKIIVKINGQPQRVFGWDVAADSAEYKRFLSQLVPALRAFLKEHDWLDRCYFHISDEPNESCLDSYRRAYDAVKDLLKGCHMIDALSDYSFYEQGLVSLPVPSNDHISPFLEHHVSPLWTYYCCAQGDRVCNRFLCMPSYRNRALGYQLFIHDIAGFLQWGYNYWFCQKSKAMVNPFTGEPQELPVFPAGDAMIVYPGEDGPLCSLRQLVFEEGLQDMRACQLLASRTSKQEVTALIREETGCSFEFDQYPKADNPLLHLREAINARLAN